MKKNYQYDHCDNDMISVAEIEELLLDYFREDELNDRGCSYNGRWFSLSSVMEAITKNM